MRNRFDRQLLELNNELIQMGSLIEQAIEMGISALVKQDVEKAEQAIKFDVEVDEQEKTIEALCMKLQMCIRDRRGCVDHKLPGYSKENQGRIPFWRTAA